MFRMFAVAAVAALALTAAAEAKDSHKPPPKIIFTKPIVVTGHPNDVSAPMAPGSGGQGSATITCDSHNRCSAQLN